MSTRLINPYAVGERVYLRPLDRDDVDDLLQWIHDPEITATLTFRWPLSRAQEEVYIDDIYAGQKEMTLGIALREDNRLIGAIGLHAVDTIHRRATFGLFIGETVEWGKGYGTAATKLMIEVAFGRLNLRRLELDVYSYNAAARRIYEKLGFQLEGTRRQHIYWQGAYHDVHLMALLRDEYAIKGQEA